MKRLLALCFALLASTAIAAEPVLLDLTGATPGTYLLTVGADGKVTIGDRPLQVLKPGSTTSPTNPTNPPGTNTPFAAKVAQLTKEALDKGASRTTAAGLVNAFLYVSNAVKDGTIQPGQAVTLSQFVVGEVFSSPSVTDDDKWVAWRTELGNAMNTLDTAGELKIPESLDDVVAGMSATLGTPIPNPNANGPPGKFFEGIDIEKIMAIIDRIIKLIELFTKLKGL